MRVSLASALAATAILLATGSSSGASTPADQQLAWVVSLLNNATKQPPAAALRKHFAPSFLRVIPPDKLVEGLASVASARPFRVGEVLARDGQFGLQARIDGRGGTSLKVSIHVTADASHRIDGLQFEPIAVEISSWRSVDARLRKLAGAPSLYAATADGKALHTLAPDRVGAIGSAFKLYVLGALADAVKAGTASWTEQLPIHRDWKSLPSGDMRNAPAGKRFTLRHYAEQMISVSDNTAADHLIHRLGRPAVEAELGPLGSSAITRNEPFLTTRELFALKLVAPAGLRNAFAAAGTERRRRLLPRVDALGLSGAMAAPWPAPIAIESIEWFASPRDLAHAIAALVARSHTRGLGPVRSILAINPGVKLDRSIWRYVGYKGGSESGVLSLTWYLVRQDGKAFVLSIVLNDPKHEIDELGAISVAQAAIALLAKA